MSFSPPRWLIQLSLTGPPPSCLVSLSPALLTIHPAFLPKGLPFLAALPASCTATCTFTVYVDNHTPHRHCYLCIGCFAIYNTRGFVKFHSRFTRTGFQAQQGEREEGSSPVFQHKKCGYMAVTVSAGRRWSEAGCHRSRAALRVAASARWMVCTHGGGPGWSAPTVVVLDWPLFQMKHPLCSPECEMLLTCSCSLRGSASAQRNLGWWVLVLQPACFWGMHSHPRVVVQRSHQLPSQVQKPVQVVNSSAPELPRGSLLEAMCSAGGHILHRRSQQLVAASPDISKSSCSPGADGLSQHPYGTGCSNVKKTLMQRLEGKKTSIQS